MSTAANILSTIIIGLFAFVFFFVIFGAFIWYYINKFRHRDREERSLESVLLEVTVPRNNEVKIDAMEQMIVSLSSVKESGWKMRFKTPPVISFEVVARSEDIRFYVWVFKEYRDLIEKQIHGAYSDAN